MGSNLGKPYTMKQCGWGDARRGLERSRTPENDAQKHELGKCSRQKFLTVDSQGGRVHYYRACALHVLCVPVLFRICVHAREMSLPKQAAAVESWISRA